MSLSFNRLDSTIPLSAPADGAVPDLSRDKTADATALTLSCRANRARHSGTDSPTTAAVAPRITSMISIWIRVTPAVVT